MNSHSELRLRIKTDYWCGSGPGVDLELQLILRVLKMRVGKDIQLVPRAPTVDYITTIYTDVFKLRTVKTRLGMQVRKPSRRRSIRMYLNIVLGLGRCV